MTFKLSFFSNICSIFDFRPNLIALRTDFIVLRIHLYNSKRVSCVIMFLNRADHLMIVELL